VFTLYGDVLLAESATYISGVFMFQINSLISGDVFTYPPMPYYIKCWVEDTWLTESRPLSTWRALEALAKRLLPDGCLIRLPENRKVYKDEEAAAWLKFFFKVRDYRPEHLPVNLSNYYVGPSAIDYERLAADLGVGVEEAVVLVKMVDKPLMVAAAEEALQAVRHSHQHGHVVQLVRGRV
jgi:hypothetical protein